MARYHNNTGRSRLKIKPPFVALRHATLDSKAWLRTSATARAAYLEVHRLYNGFNNGRLALSVRDLGQRLNCSKDTASRVLRELDDNGFIRPMKIGRFDPSNRMASEYRLTEYRCDVTGQKPSREYFSV
jgi:hypothetical protein